MSHTPGPWEWTDKGLIHPDGIVVSNMCVSDADAAMIEAAPDMYKALKAAVRILLGDADATADMDVIRKAGLRALAKAEGKA